ncbi:MAG TPA: glycoside hydrolase family 16 protein [Polyangia bacterium]
MRAWLVVGSLLAAALGFVVAVALAAGCDTSPLYPDMVDGDLSPLPPAGDLGDGADLPAPDQSDASMPGRTLVWSDEFEGAAGAPPDATKWSFDVGGSGWGNGELEYSTARPENVALDGAGHLAITARAEAYMGKEYTSGRINSLSQFTHAFGRFEARMQLPTGQGIWPAFWLLGDNVSSVGWPQCGEIDIIENKGQEPNIVHGTVHGPGYSGGNGISAMRTVPGAPLSDGFHVYAIEWFANLIVFSVDGNSYFTVSPQQLPANTQWVFDHPFGVILDLAVGGGYVGSPDATTTFPQTLLVDYVRVYEPQP